MISLQIYYKIAKIAPVETKMNEQDSLPSENAGLKSKKRSKLPYIIGGSAGGLVLTIVVIFMVHKYGRATTNRGSSVKKQNKTPFESKSPGESCLEGDVKSDKNNSVNQSKDDEPKPSSEKEEEGSGKNTDQSVNNENPQKLQTEVTNQKTPKDITLASEKSKSDVSLRLLAISQAKSKASEVIAKYSAELDPQHEDFKTFHQLSVKVQAATNFDEISNIIIGEYKWDDTFITHVYDQLHSKLSMMHLEIMAKYFEVCNEDSSVVDSLNSLAQNVGNNKMSSYECAEAWGKVILKMKNLEEIRHYADSLDKVKRSREISRFSKFPARLFEKGNLEKLNKLRELHPDKALMLLSAKSTADALEKICALDLELSTGKELHEFFTIVNIFFWDYAFIPYLAICPYDDSANGKILLDHIKEVVKREVVKPPPGLDVQSYNVQSYFNIPKDIADYVKRESPSSDELEKWTKFGADYEMIMGSGLEKNAANEKYFEAYRKLTSAFTKDNLNHFFELILKKPTELKDIEKVAILIGQNCNGYSELVIRSVVKTLWKINDAERIAANIITLRNASDTQIFSFLMYNGFKFPFLLNIIDDDIVRELCHKQYDVVVDLPDNFEFKRTPEFNEFVGSLRKLQSKFIELGHSDGEFFKLSTEVTITKPEFAPSIGFLKPELKSYFPQEFTNVIEAYKKLAFVIGDPEILIRMIAEVTYIEQASDNKPVETAENPQGELNLPEGHQLKIMDS